MAVLGKYLIELAQGTENQVILFVIGLITTLMTAFIWSRLAIVLPSAALDHSLSIQSAWDISDDYSAKIIYWCRFTTCNNRSNHLLHTKL